MPDRVITRVIQLGQQCKRQRIGHRLQFLNRIKQQFSWDDGDEEEDAPLVQEHETDVLPAEIPGVQSEEDDKQVNSVNDSPVPTRALTNANLRSASLPAPQIAGVDDDDLIPHPVSDYESNGEESDEESVGEDIDEGPADEHEEGQTGESIEQDNDAPEFEQAEEFSSDEEEEEDVPPLRRLQRIRKKKEALTIEFANRAYQEKDGVLHINPAVLEAARENTKITSEILPKPTDQIGKIHVVLPQTGTAASKCV
jgi:hypothetical protein